MHPIIGLKKNEKAGKVLFKVNFSMAAVQSFCECCFNKTRVVIASVILMCSPDSGQDVDINK